MSRKPLVVEPGAPLSEVAAAMLRRQAGVAVVAEKGQLLGVFTTVDSLRALVAVLAGQAPEGSRGRRPIICPNRATHRGGHDGRRGNESGARTAGSR